MWPNKEIDDLRKAGKLDEAYVLAHKLLDQSPQDLYLKNSLGWVIWARVKAAREAAHEALSAGDGAGKHVAEIRACLKEYASLALPRPDLLFSVLVTNVCLLEEPPEWLLDFLVWAGPDSWRPEDFRADPAPDGKSYTPLVAKVALKAGKLAHEGSDLDKKRFALELVESAHANAPSEQDEWLVYRRALLLGDLGREEDAIPVLIPFVRDKSNQFWAWHALGRLEEASDPAKALGLLAKAKLLCKDPVFALPLLEDIGRVALECDQPSLAKWAVSQAVATRSAHDYKLPQSLRDLVEGEWYLGTVEPDDPIGTLRDFAERADRVVYSDLPRHDASFLLVFSGKDGRERAKFVVCRSAEAEEIVCLVSAAPGVQRMAPGAPVALRVLDGERGPRVVDVEPRNEGGPFDCLTNMQGVVQHQNVEKQLVSVYLGPDDFVLLRYSDFPTAEELAPGQGLELRCATHADRLHAYHMQVREIPDSDDIRHAHGPLRKNQRGFAFVGDDLFVNPHLAESWDDGQLVEVLAIRQRDRKDADKLQWNAVVVRALD